VGVGERVGGLVARDRSLVRSPPPPPPAPPRALSPASLRTDAPQWACPPKGTQTTRQDHRMTVIVSSRWLKGIVGAHSGGQAMIASAAVGGDAAAPRGDGIAMRRPAAASDASGSSGAIASNSAEPDRPRRKGVATAFVRPPVPTARPCPSPSSGRTFASKLLAFALPLYSSIPPRFRTTCFLIDGARFLGPFFSDKITSQKSLVYCDIFSMRVFF
jgi:hypothetical protein